MPPPDSTPPHPTASCPRCGSLTANPFAGAGGVCLRCAGERAFALGTDTPFESIHPDAPTEPADPLDLAARADTSALDTPARIGRYEIIEELGRGGMGRVYAARQSGLGRIVALKVLSLGPGAPPEFEMRFLREAQTVARLRHPHIIAIHDSGRAPGCVFFSMEYIEGGDLSRRLRERAFAPRDSAALVAKLAGALAHAHAEGILHRDLKPSNILLDGDEPRLADFGLATQLETSGDFTSASGVFGTPHYLAPEALTGGGAALSTASDLYALGVVLYLLLTGRTPFAGASPAELPALVADTEPPAPRLLAPATPRDLETICLKLLERDPARRYSGAAALAADLRRFLAGEAILASPPGRFDRFGRFARRHRVALLAATAAFLALAVATVVSTSLAIRASRAEKTAATEAATSGAVVDFLQNDLLAQASPDQQPDRDLKLRTVLDRAAHRIDGRFPDQPLVEASLRETVAKTYSFLGEYGTARHHQEQAVAIYRRTLGKDHLRTLAATTRLADTLYELAEYQQAGWLAAPTLAAQQRLLGAEHHDTLLSERCLAVILQAEGQAAPAELRLRHVVDTQQRLLGPEHLETIESIGCLSSVYLDEGKFAEAAALLQPMLEICRRTKGPENSYTMLAMNNLAGAFWGQGRFAEAAGLHRENLALCQRILGPEHPDTLRVMNNVARCASAEGRFAEAVALHRQILAIRRRALGPDYHDTLRSLSFLATALRDLGAFAEAESLFAQALENDTRVLGADHPDTRQCADEFGTLLLARGKFAEAAALLRPSVDRHSRLSPAEWQTGFARLQLGTALLGLDRPTEAEPLLALGAADLNAAAIPAAYRRTVADAGARLEQLYTHRGQPDEGRRWREKLPPPPRAG